MALRSPTAEEAPPVAADICRGACRSLIDLGYAPLTELPLPNGRRADIAALDQRGHVVIVEVKSSRVDFTTDRKWPDYLLFCDALYFAVAPRFPVEILPEEAGLILADRYGGEIVRGAPETPMPAGRRKAWLIRFARLGALRLQGLADPQL